MNFRKDNYVMLWLLLAVAFAAVVGYALYEDLTIGTYTPKKAPIVDALIEEFREKDSVAFDQESLVALSDSLSESKLDSLPQSVFIFGDSMTYNLALRLAEYAKQNGHQINSINWDSSNTKIWADSDTLKYYINKFHPTQVFICLGSNELYVKNPESRLPYIKKILSDIGSIPYVWIGPPNWKEDGGINDLLARTCRPGSFFRSKGMQFERRKDGIHPTQKSSALWMDSIMRWIPKSAHPFIAEVPSDTIGEASPNLIVLKALNK